MFSDALELDRVVNH